MTNSKTGTIAALAILLALSAPSFAQTGAGGGNSDNGGSAKTGAGDSSQSTPGSDGGGKTGDKVGGTMGDTSKDSKSQTPTTTTKCPSGMAKC